MAPDACGTKDPDKEGYAMLQLPEEPELGGDMVQGARADLRSLRDHGWTYIQCISAGLCTIIC